jgi:lysophospholipase L1-like esterase
MATLHEIETIAAEIEAAQKRLAAAVAASPELFTKKRSIILHGVKTGFQQQHGSLTWNDDAAIVAAIRQQMPDHYNALVKVTEEPNKEALAEVDPATLRALGVKVNPAGTRVIVKLIEAVEDKQLSLPLNPEETS